MNQHVIHPYTDQDAAPVGILIADTYREFNLSFVGETNLAAFLGPFHFARSEDPVHKQAVIEILRSPMMHVAEVDGTIAGVLRGRHERLASLFVHQDFHRQGIGRRLVESFEAESLRQGVRVIRLAATLYAVPFYMRMGYVRSTGLRQGWSFQGHGLPYQPMKKKLSFSGTGLRASSSSLAAVRPSQQQTARRPDRAAG